MIPRSCSCEDHPSDFAGATAEIPLLSRLPPSMRSQILDCGGQIQIRRAQSPEPGACGRASFRCTSPAPACAARNRMNSPMRRMLAGSPKRWRGTSSPLRTKALRSCSREETASEGLQTMPSNPMPDTRMLALPDHANEQPELEKANTSSEIRSQCSPDVARNAREQPARRRDPHQRISRLEVDVLSSGLDAYQRQSGRVERVAYSSASSTHSRSSEDVFSASRRISSFDEDSNSPHQFKRATSCARGMRVDLRTTTPRQKKMGGEFDLDASRRRGLLTKLLAMYLILMIVMFLRMAATVSNHRAR
jgi:hypothetical protein